MRDNISVQVDTGGALISVTVGYRVDFHRTAWRMCPGEGEGGPWAQDCWQILGRQSQFTL